MATLNTLRTRGGVIIIIVIGLALLSFILSDLKLSGSNDPSKIKVGEIDGKKITYFDYVNRIDYVTSMEKLMSGRDNFNADEIEHIRDMAWDDLISQYSMAPALANMGFTVSEAEQIDMVSGNNISPVVSQIFADPNTGVFDPQYLKMFIAAMNNDPSGTYVSMWDYIKSKMNQERAVSKYITTVTQGMFVTDLEVEHGIYNANSVSSIAYVMESYDAIPDSIVNVTAAEIKEYYNEHKNLFRQSASRDIEYVVFDVLPSEEDYAEAERYVADLAREFQESETPLQYAILNSQSQVSQLYYGPEQMYEGLSAFAFGPNRNSLYGPVLEGDVYTLARVTDVQNRPDTLGARHILLQPGQTALADSLVNVIRKGDDFALLALQYSMDQETAIKGGDIGVFPTEYIIADLAVPLMNAHVNDVMTINTSAGLHVIQLTYKSKPREKVQVAIITYNVEPSEYTNQAIYSEATDFMSKAADNYDAFKNAVTESGLSKRVARVRASERTLNGMENSHEVLRWAFNAKAGDVSSILEINGDYIIAAVAAATADGIAPLNMVSEDITDFLRHQKKGEILSAQMDGKPLASLAAERGSEILEASGIEFNSFYIDGVGVETKLIGAVSAAPENTLSKPVTGAGGVYVFEVTGRELAESTTPEMEKARQQASAESYIIERISQALLQQSEVKDNRIMYF